MTYVIVHGGGLSGQWADPRLERPAGPPRSSGGGRGMFTQWGNPAAVTGTQGQWGIFDRGAGRKQLGSLAMGAVEISDALPENAKRELLAAAFNEFAEGLRAQLVELLDTKFDVKAGLLAANPVGFLAARDRLVVARDQIRAQLVPTGTIMIRDGGLPLSEVRRRLAEVMQSYASTVDAQISAARVQGERATFSGQVNLFLEAVGKVIATTSSVAARAIIEGAKAGANAAIDSPATAILIAALVAGGLYLKFRK